jgi:putative ABC transport system ATP-binding protein
MNEHAQAMVRLEGIVKTFGRGDRAVHALTGLSLTVPAGAFVAIMGPSGSGKSTLLHLIGGLDVPDAGEIVVDGQSLRSLSDDELTLYRRRRIGFVFQFFNLLPLLSAEENVALPLLLDGQRWPAVRERVERALDLVGLAARRRHRPAELSGGEMQRVAIARALVIEPLLLLADEPTGNLDSTTGEEILKLLRRAATVHGQTILMVTHDPRGAAVGDRIVRLRDGRIVADPLPP